MITPTIRGLCAALAGDVNYLIACIRDGSSDSCALQECLDRANTARDLLAAEPVGEVPSAAELTQFLFDNFRGPIELICDAEEEARVVIQNHIKFALAAFARWGRPAAPPAPEVGEVGEAERLPGVGDCDAEGR